MRLLRQAHNDRVAGVHAAAATHHRHHAGLAHKRAVGVAIQHFGGESGLEAIDLAARIAQARDLHLRLRTELQHRAGRQREQVDAARGHVLAEISREHGVIFFDLAGYDVEGYNKFIPYYLFPDSTYTVSVSPSSFRTKISVGSNPWAAEEPKHNLATICERYGGGGHARVGAISLSPGELEQARAIAAEIVAELET